MKSYLKVYLLNDYIYFYIYLFLKKLKTKAFVLLFVHLNIFTFKLIIA